MVPERLGSIAGFAEYSYNGRMADRQVHDSSHTFYCLLQTNQLIHATNTHTGRLQVTLCPLVAPVVVSLKTHHHFPYTCLPSTQPLLNFSPLHYLLDWLWFPQWPIPMTIHYPLSHMSCVKLFWCAQPPETLDWWLINCQVWINWTFVKLLEFPTAVH